MPRSLPGGRSGPLLFFLMDGGLFASDMGPFLRH